MYKEHKSVLYDEVLGFATTALNDSQSKLMVDLTFGAGGHSLGLLELNESAVLYGVDQDRDALENASQLIKKKSLESKLKILDMNFEKFPQWAANNNLNENFAFILADLGVSSHHFDESQRGFSFRSDGPLDMRMNQDSTGPTASDLVNQLSEAELADIFFYYGEERLARKIARKICEQRVKKPFNTTKELEDLVFHSYPPQQRFGKTHPATRCFQALRIKVNNELSILENIIPKLYELLAPGGMLAVISFHSLEDRIVKNNFKLLVENFPNQVTILSKKPLVASTEEIELNSRSRSAKMRVLQRAIQPGRVDGTQKEKTKNKYQKNH